MKSSSSRSQLQPGPSRSLRPWPLRGVAALVALGGVWLSVPRPGNADAPAGRYTVTAGAATDTKTGLVWQVASSPSMTRGLADDYCASLTTNGGGWRLPAARELLTLADLSGGAPAIDSATFPNTAPLCSWTTNVLKQDQFARVHVVDFRDGSLVLQLPTSACRTRCVR